MVVLVPAAGVIETLRSGAAAGARSATVFSAGFGEGFDLAAAELGRELAAVIEEPGSACRVPTAWAMSAPRAGWSHSQRTARSRCKPDRWRWSARAAA